MVLLFWFFLILIAVSWAYWLVVLGTALHFFSQKHPDSSFLPPISILKPVKGMEPGAYENFASFLKQDYPEYEVLFGLEDPDDPALLVIRQIQRDFPSIKVELYITPPLGTNRKVAILHHLQEKASHEILVLSDSDIRVRKDFLKDIVAPLADEKVGLVSSFYRSEQALSLAAKVESLLISTLMLPSGILGSYLIGLRYAFGAAIALRRKALENMGGFKVIKDHLADDHQLGALIGRAGWGVVLSNHVVSNMMNHISWRGFWDRQLRWMRVASVCRRKEYPGMLMIFTFPLSLTFMFLSLFSPLSLWLFIGSLALRLSFAYCFAAYLGHRQMRRWLFLLPIADFFYFLLWIKAMFTSRVTWRQHEFILLPDGRMKPNYHDSKAEEERF